MVTYLRSQVVINGGHLLEVIGVIIGVIRVSLT